MKLIRPAFLLLLLIPLSVSADTMTFTVAGNSDNGSVLNIDSVYPPSSTIIVNDGNPFVDGTSLFVVAGRAFNSGSYIVANALFRWDTSALPDNATVISATLRCWVNPIAFVDADHLAATADWYTDWPIDETDYSFSPATTALTSFPLASISSSTTQDIPLSNTSGVSLTGYTGLRFTTPPGLQPDLMASAAARSATSAILLLNLS